MHRMHLCTTNHCNTSVGKKEVHHDWKKCRLRREDGILPARTEDDVGLLLCQFKLFFAMSIGCLVARNKRLSFALPLVVLPTPLVVCMANSNWLFCQLRSSVLALLMWLRGLGTFLLGLLPWEVLVVKSVNSLMAATRARVGSRQKIHKTHYGVFLFIFVLLADVSQAIFQPPATPTKYPGGDPSLNPYGKVASPWVFYQNAAGDGCGCETCIPLKTAVDLCLDETPDGSCPIFAATTVPDGQGSGQYGPMGEWDVSKVTLMTRSTYNIF